MVVTRRMTILAPVAVLLTGCDLGDMGDWGGNLSRHRQPFSETRLVKPGAHLDLETRNGSVEVLGWEKESAEITGEKYASSEELLRGIKVDIQSTPDRLTIRTNGPIGDRVRNVGWGAKYVLRVPRRMLLDSLKSSNGSVRVENIEGPARVTTSNGSVRALRLTGDLEARTSNASIETRGLKGRALLTTSNGSITVDEVHGEINAVTSNSSIRVNLQDPEPNKRIRLETSNGSVELEAAKLNNNPIRAHTSNSSVTLRLPAEINAMLTASTSNSSIQSDFPVNGTQSKTRISGTVGSGGPEIDVSTSNGGVRIRRM